MKLKSRKGFTLIELIIVLVIIGILAAVAMPRFANIQENAQINSIKGTVGNVRSALTIAKAQNLVDQTHVATNYWPTIAELKLSETAGSLTDTCPLDSIMPKNPLLPAGASNTITLVSVAQANTRGVVANAFGWNYDESRGIFYANSNTTLPSGTPVNENDF